MSDRPDHDAYLGHTDFGDFVELSCTGTPGSPITVVVDRATGETTTDANDPMTAADLRILQEILDRIGEHGLGCAMRDRCLG
ncbi:hypothetical protein [Amycolatopsis sp. NPDC004079]|uniref:hypothetical protein n=1 Tax=Amycolatopsis sp. NPDC004079 TaxID=3154549 RepID=UPI0033A4D69D